jgi:hypothetical protein
MHFIDALVLHAVCSPRGHLLSFPSELVRRPFPTSVGLLSLSPASRTAFELLHPALRRGEDEEDPACSPPHLPTQ